MNESSPLTKLGINPEGNLYGTETKVPKVTTIYQSQQQVQMLRSTASPALDTFSVPKQLFPAEGDNLQWFGANKETWIQKMNNDNALDYVERALRLAKKRHYHIQHNVIGGDTLEPMYNSIVQQLVFLHDVITGLETDKAKLWKLTFGMYATKEFETTDPIFEDRLGDAFYIASQIRRGLKVKLPHQVDPDFDSKQKRLESLYADDFYV